MVPNSQDWLLIRQDSLDLNTLEISKRKKLRLFSYQYFRTGTNYFHIGPTLKVNFVASDAQIPAENWKYPHSLGIAGRILV